MAPMADLLLRRAPAAPGEVYDVLRGRRIVGRIMLSNGSAASQWVWTISYQFHEDRTPTHGYEATREAAMAAFAKSWRREKLQHANHSLGVEIAGAAGKRASGLPTDTVRTRDRPPTAASGALINFGQILDF